MSDNPIERHLATLNLAFRRSVPLPGNGGVVHRMLLSQLPQGDPRCGVLTHSFQYGGSVPEGWAETTTLVLPDAMIQTDDYDLDTNTFVIVSATTELRADELERLVRQAAARVK